MQWPSDEHVPFVLFRGLLTTQRLPTDEVGVLEQAAVWQSVLPTRQAPLAVQVPDRGSRDPDKNEHKDTLDVVMLRGGEEEAGGVR